MRTTARWIGLMAGTAGLLWAGFAVAGQEEQKHGSGGMMMGHDEAAPEMHSHGKSMLHGGVVSMTKDHHFETVFAPDGISVYIYTEGQSPMVAEGVKGTATLTFKDGKKKAVPMTVETPAEGEKAVYFCPMHASVVQMEPGVCKLCGGMKLYTQDRLVAKTDLSKVEPGTLAATFTISGFDGPEPQATFTEHNDKPAAHEAEAKPEGQAPASGKKAAETD